MADNYLQFSEVLPNLSPEEETWLKDQLQDIRVFGERECLEDDMPAELADAEPEWRGPRFLRDCGDFDPAWNTLEFQYAFDDDEHDGDWGRHLWLYAEDNGNPDYVAWLVRKFLKKFRPEECWSLTYATTCSKPRVGEFAGGAVFVTAEEIKWQNAYEFIEQERTAFEAGKAV